MMNIYHKVSVVACIAALLFITSFAVITSDDSQGATVSVNDQTSLLNAVNSAQNGDTILVTQDIVLNELIYVADKHITIEGAAGSNITISRASVFAQHFDRRGWYNPAMIEVAASPSDTSKTSSLTLLNITLDDRNAPGGPYAFQYPWDSNNDPSVDTTKYVYDAVMAAYSDRATITLGEGAKIINIGGASAIRVDGGILNLEEGSYVQGTNGSSGSLFGTLWFQGGATLNFDTTIDGSTLASPYNVFDAKYIYSDMSGGTYNFTGKIINCTFKQPLFYNVIGSNYALNFSSTGEFSGNTVSAGVNYIISQSGQDNTINFFGKISGNTGGSSIFLFSGSTRGTLLINGEISNNVVSGQTICFAQGLDCIATIGKDGKISGNKVNIGAIYLNYATNIKFNIYGEISNNISLSNNAGALYAIYNNPRIFIYDGARIIGNTAYGAGGAIYLNYTATLTMYGGEISGNIAQCKDMADAGLAGGGGVCVARSATFIMNGGTISGNYAGIAGYPGIGGGVFVSGKTTSVTTGGRFIMNGGTVSGNFATSVTDGADIAIGGSNNNISPSIDKGQFIQIGKDAVIGTNPIGVSKYDGTYVGPAVFLTDRSGAVRIGALLDTVKLNIANKATVMPEYSGYSLQNSSVWYSVDGTTGTSSFTITYPAKIGGAAYDHNDYNWLAVIQPMGANATDPGTNTVFLVPTRADNGLIITIPLIATSSGGVPIEGYNVVILAELKDKPLKLDVKSSGSGDFYIPDGLGGSLYSIILNPPLLGNPQFVDNFVISPAPGWEIKSVILTAGDGTVFDKTADALSGNLKVSYNELATGANTITAVFTIIPTPPEPKQYTITATADSGSTITPSGKVTVQQGGSQTFAFKAKEGYKITEVLIDGL
ncbi:MAG: hypothetical protein FWC52_04760, partial [Candidatus Methanoplasma sp.]|nr:hypothetical protein [Candidatus Methanoplasma sp.]